MSYGSAASTSRGMRRCPTLAYKPIWTRPQRPPRRPSRPPNRAPLPSQARREPFSPRLIEEARERDYSRCLVDEDQGLGSGLPLYFFKKNGEVL